MVFGAKKNGVGVRGLYFFSLGAIALSYGGWGGERVGGGALFVLAVLILKFTLRKYRAAGETTAGQLAKR